MKTFCSKCLCYHVKDHVYWELTDYSDRCHRYVVAAIPSIEVSPKDVEELIIDNLVRRGSRRRVH